MMKFRRKPEYVEAVQLTQAAIDAHVLDGAPLPDGCIVTSWEAHPPTRKVHRAVARLRNKGRDLVMPGDWIVRSADSAFSVCKPDEFEAMYEAVDANPAADLTITCQREQRMKVTR